MPWFRSLRDDLTLSPFEDDQDEPSESVAMASTAPADVSANQDPAEVTEECPGKKKSKFQTFKNFFSRKRRKAPPGGEDLKCSVSSDDLSKSREQPSPRADSDKANGSEVGLGSRAQSHDSVFASDWSENHDALGASQDSLHGKVKNLQMQLKQAMRLGAPPSLLCVKRTEDNGTVSEDDGLPCSPPDFTPSKTKPQRNSSISLDSAEGQSSCPVSSRAVSPLVVAPGDFSSPASASVCLDTSAARHKLGLRQRGRRRPAARQELKSKVDSLLDDTLSSSTADDTGVIADEELKDEDVEVTIELNGAEDSEETEETSAEPRGPNPDQNLDQNQDQEPNPGQNQDQELNPDSEEEEEEHRVEEDSPGSSPEPPAGEREYLLDGSQDRLRLSESSLEEKLGEALSEEEEEEEEGEAEGESSLLLEVLSSLKTPLTGMDAALTEHHQREPEDAEVQRVEEEPQEAAVRPQSAEDDDNDAPEEDNHEVEPEEQEVEADVREVGVSFCDDADDEAKRAEEESEEELEVECFRPSEVIPENTKEDIHEFQLGDKMALLTKYSDSEEEEETQHDMNFIDGQILDQNEEEVGEILDSIEQEVTESEEEEMRAAILVQEEKQTQETMDQDVENENDGKLKIELDIGMQNSAKVDEIEGNSEAEEELMEEEIDVCEIADEKRDSEVPVMEFDSEEAKIEEENDEEEAVSQEEIAETEDKEERDLTSCEMSQTKTSTTTLEINLVSPSAEKHVRFSDGFTEARDDILDQTEDTHDEESVEVSIAEKEEMQELENLGKTEDEGEILDKMQDESVDVSTAEREEQEGFGEMENDVDMFDKAQEESITISMRKAQDEDILGKDVGMFDKEDKIQDEEHGEVSVVEAEDIQKEESEELKEEVRNVDKTQEEELSVSRNQSENSEIVGLKRESSEKQVSKPEPSRPKFTVATAWQRSLSIGEKDEDAPPTPPGTGSENHKVPTESRPDPEKVPSEARPEIQQVQESRPEIKEVQEPRPEIQKVQESQPEPEIKVQESRPEVVPETVKVKETVEGVTQNPFGVRLRRTQALQRFISEDGQKQDVQTNKVEPPPSLSPSTKQPISPKPTPAGQPITVKSPPPNPPITVKPSVLSLPITNKPPPPNPPISAKPVVPRKPEMEGGNKLKRTSDAASEPPSWISVAKHKQKVYKESSSVTSKEETGKKTQESSKVISLNLKPASPLSPPTPVPPMAPKPSHSCPAPAPSKPLSPPPALSSSSSSARPMSQNPSHSCPCPAPAPVSPPSSPSSPPPRVTSPQEEPPWMAMAKKKAKAWSEMPQIVQ